MTAAAKPTFGYWEIRGGTRGAVNRYLLAHAGVDFEEVRYSSKAEWGAAKSNLGVDFPNIPYIIDGDFFLTESKAVSVYICDRWCPELMGSTPVERASIVMMQ